MTMTKKYESDSIKAQGSSMKVECGAEHAAASTEGHRWIDPTVEQRSGGGSRASAVKVKHDASTSNASACCNSISGQWLQPADAIAKSSAIERYISKGVINKDNVKQLQQSKSSTFSSTTFEGDVRAVPFASANEVGEAISNREGGGFSFPRRGRGGRGRKHT